MDSAEVAGETDLFLELAGATRRLMLESLARRPARMSTLARELDVTVQDVHRNVNRMAGAGLIERNDSMLHLTETGRMVANRSSSCCGPMAQSSSQTGVIADRSPSQPQNRVAAWMIGVPVRDRLCCGTGRERQKSGQP